MQPAKQHATHQTRLYIWIALIIRIVNRQLVTLICHSRSIHTFVDSLLLVCVYAAFIEEEEIKRNMKQLAAKTMPTRFLHVHYYKFFKFIPQR